MATFGNIKRAEFYACEKCLFKCSKKSDYERHITTLKHKKATFGTIKNAGDYAGNYTCDFCDYKCCKKSDYERHITTLKHKNAQKNATAITEYTCKCGKYYKHRASLYKHKKTCMFIQTNFNVLVNKQQEIMDKQDEHYNKIIKDLTDKISSMSLVTQTQNNIQNNTQNNFNLQFFLNEQCKDAIDFDSFLKQIKINVDDMMMFGNTNYNDSMISIINRTLGSMDIYKRPLHCTDQKRKVFYSKLDDGSWEKDTDKKQLTRLINDITSKSTKYLYSEWEEGIKMREKDPDTHEFKWYMRVAKNVAACDEDGYYTNKVLKHIITETYIHNSLQVNDNKSLEAI